MEFPGYILNLSPSFLHHFGYLIVFLAATLEAMPAIGSIVPGHSIVIAAGFLAKLGVLDPGDAMFFAGAGAVLGDFIGYFIGRRYGRAFITRYGKYVFFKKEYLEKTTRLVKAHPGKTLIVGRFNLVTRAIAPFAAGMSRVPMARFALYNIIGGVSWAVASVLIGYIFGASFEVVSYYIGWFIAVAIVVGIGIAYGYRFVNKRKRIFERFHLYAVSLNIAALYLFAKMIEDVIDGETVVRLDVWINHHMVALWNPLLTSIMRAVTAMGSAWVLFIASVVLLGVLIAKKKWHQALLLWLAMGGGLAIEFLTKLIIHRVRPAFSLITENGYSFPSGHATMATIFFALILYSFREDFKQRIARTLFTAATIFVFVLVGFSRLYLGVHWFSDVLAGFSLGIFWLTFLILIFRVVAALATHTVTGVKRMLLLFFNDIL